MTTTNTRITVATTVRASVKRAWEIWSQPAHIMKWNNASDDWHTPRAENNLTVGGSFNSRMQSRDSKMGFDFTGKYTEVELYKKIAYTLDDGRTVEILFSENDGSTTITETFEAEQINPIEMQREGWQAILDNFKKYAESLPPYEKIRFDITINAPADKVYRLMLNDESYRRWTSVFNPHSHYKGSWNKGSKILFIGSDDKGNTGGMVSRIAENIPNKFVSIEHLGVLEGEKEITSGPAVDSWAGAKENYSFDESNGLTKLSVEMDSNEEFKSYFNETWPKALKVVKEMCEK
jgi:uncharacterized protein YndB with AHSA1/START domain